MPAGRFAIPGFEHCAFRVSDWFRISRFEFRIFGQPSGSTGSASSRSRSSRRHGADSVEAGEARDPGTGEARPPTPQEGWR